MRYLEHVTSLGAAVLGAFYIVATVYLIILHGFIPGVLFHITFVDLVSIAVRIAAVPVIIKVAVLAAYSMEWMVRHLPKPKNSFLRSMVIWILRGFTLFALVGLPIVWFVYPYYKEFNDYRIISDLLGFTVILGFYIVTIVLFLLHLNDAGRRAGELFPLLGLVPSILAVVTVAAASDGRRARECDRPDTVVYADSASQKLEPHQLCPVLSLERGLLFFDKEARAAVFITWSQLANWTRPSPRA